MMGTVCDKWDDDEGYVIGEKGEIGFIDYEDDKSVCSYNPTEEDPNPIIISFPFAFVEGKPQSVFVGETAANSIYIKNTTGEPVDLWSVKIYASNPENSFTLSLMEPPSQNSDVETISSFLESFSLEDRMLQPGETLTVWLCCKPKVLGLHTSVVYFDVAGEIIERVVFLLADDKISKSMSANKPYSRVNRKKHIPVDSFVPGSRPARTTGREVKKRLPRYEIPKEIRELLEGKHVPDAVKEGLTLETYASYFKTLLIMEEIQLEGDMRAYDMNRVSMKRRGQCLALEVPGLAEKRPSLVHGDYIIAKMSSECADDTTSYQGYVFRVEADEVYLKFAPEFHLHHRNENLYNVQFTYNRINMRRLYQAIEAAEHLPEEFLFPFEFSQRRHIRTTRLVPISRNLNEEQTHSIEMILGCKGAPPYLIHGPPGTGKTMTLVEAILQIYTTRQNSRVLVCAPSNSAADYVLERLLCKKDIEVKENDIFRLNATTRPYEEVKPDHLCFCFFDGFIFKCPPFDALLRYRIIISTYMSASLLYAEGVRRGHFSHIFLDEAGQATEPETMIPISNLCLRKTVVVLAGDPMQLGPVIYSKEADNHGFGKSYLERLFECEYYVTGDRNYITKLVRNYRCHPAILHLPSILFYAGELIACKDGQSSLMNNVDMIKLLPNKEFPVLFFGIQGCDEREGNNPSWFNRIEASKVVELIKKLTASGNLSEENIGVITPYRQQVLKLKKTLEGLDMFDIKVGSVENFQGQEKQVIIISTVRSTIKHNEFDKTFCLGFLSNPKRFNVAVTRAISLLVIIGNPHIITKDTYWNKLLWYCVDNNSYEGCALPEKKELLTEALEPEEDLDLGTIQSRPEDENYNEGENDQACDGDGWNEEPWKTEIPKPVTDEAEWSDGWK